MKTESRELSIRAAEIRHKAFHLSENLRIIYMLRGELVLEFVAGRSVVKEGNIEIININEPVSFYSGTEGNLALIFEFDKEAAKKAQPLIDKALYNCNTTLFYPCRTKHKYQQQLKIKLMLLYNLYTNTDDYTLMRKISKEVEDLIVDRFHDLKNMLEDTDISDVNLDRFLRIYDSIYGGSAGKLSLKEIAEKEYVSVQYLSKEFNEKLNINFKATVEYYKVIQAARYLIATNIPVTMVSENSGFSAPRYFYKQFSLYLKCTPMEFRSRQRRDKEQLWEFSLDEENVKDAVNKLTASRMNLFGQYEGRGHENKEEKQASFESIYDEVCRIKGKNPDATFEFLPEADIEKLKSVFAERETGFYPAVMVRLDSRDVALGELTYMIEETLNYVNTFVNIAIGKGVPVSFRWEISRRSEQVDALMGYEPTEIILGLLSSPSR